MKGGMASHALLCCDIVTIQRVMHDWKYEFALLFKLGGEEQWSVNLESLLRLPFDAVVLTDSDQTILWR